MRLSTVYISRQLLSLVYSYYKTGTVASVIGQVNGTIVNEQYRYDSLQRLSNATITNGASTINQWYQYDNVGNRISQRVSATQTNYYTYQTSTNELSQTSVYNGLNHQLSTSGSFSYDKNGNLLAGNVTTGVTTHWTYSWSVKGDLLRVSNDNGVQGFYTYDGLDRRIESSESSTIFYAYLGTETLSELVSGGVTTDYVSAGGLRIAKATGTSVSYYHTDALGSTRIVTDASGKVVFSDSYQPYGQDNGTPTGSETYKFTGKPVSQTTGLYYEYQRWYDPSIGRFISEDPLAGHLSNPQSLNPYIYVQDSPTSSVDPTGMADCGLSLGGALGCLENFGGAVVNGWNSQPDWAKYTEIGVGVGAAIILTAGIAAPELLVLVPPLLIGDVGAGAGTAGLCEEDPAACDPVPPPVGEDTNPAGLCECPTLPPSGGGSAATAEGGGGGQLAQAVNRDFGVSFENHIAENFGEVRNVGADQLTISNEFGRYIPDFRSGAEAKAVQYLPQTSQMQIALLNAQETGVPLRLYVLENTVLSRQMLLAYSSGLIDLVRVPFG